MVRVATLSKTAQQCIFTYLEETIDHETFLNYCRDHQTILGIKGSRQRERSQKFKATWTQHKYSSPEKYAAKLEELFEEEEEEEEDSKMAGATTRKMKKSPLKFSDLNKVDEESLIGALNDLGMGDDDDYDYGKYC
jgi:hypothetical protein